MKQNLLQQIKAQMPTFSKGQKRIGNYIIERYDRAAYMTAAKLGEATGVSESTVVRFADELGYDGYPELQRVLQELARTNLTAAQRIDVADNRMTKENLPDKILNGDADMIRHTLEELNRQAFSDAVDKITNARHIYILGLRSSAALARFLTFNFRMIFDNAHFVDGTSGSEMFEQILNIGKEDVLIAISFPRYSKRTVRIAEYAKSAGADVVALTDSNQSPLADLACQLLTAKSDMASFVDSLVAPLSIINAMIAAVSLAKHDEVAARLSQMEKIWDEYDVYAKNNG